MKNVIKAVLSYLFPTYYSTPVSMTLDDSQLALASVKVQAEESKKEVTALKEECGQFKQVFQLIMSKLLPSQEINVDNCDPVALFEDYLKAPNNNLNAQQLADIQGEATLAHSGITALENKASSLDTHVNNLLFDVNDIQRYLREWNLLIHGLRNIPGKKVNQTLDDYEFDLIEYLCTELNERLGNYLRQPLNPTDFDRAHILYQGPKKVDKPVVIIRFVRRVVRNNVFFKRRNLKGSGISISDHLTYYNRFLMNAAISHLGFEHTWSSMGRIFANVNGVRNEITSEDCITQLANTLATPPPPDTRRSVPEGNLTSTSGNHDGDQNRGRTKQRNINRNFGRYSNNRNSYQRGGRGNWGRSNGITRPDLRYNS